MRFYKIKIDSNDTLYSKIIRYGKKRCERCQCVRPLQCAHIVGRGKHSTRFLLKPKPNAIALCAKCHDWFDSHKMRDLIFDEKKRVFNANSESYTFLVERLEYTWEDLQQLYVKSQKISPYLGFTKKQINLELKEALAEKMSETDLTTWE